MLFSSLFNKRFTTAKCEGRGQYDMQGLLIDGLRIAPSRLKITFKTDNVEVLLRWCVCLNGLNTTGSSQLGGGQNIRASYHIIVNTGSLSLSI